MGVEATVGSLGVHDGEEGRATRAIERQTSRMPSGIFLTLAFASMVASAAIMASDRARRHYRLGAARRTGIANFVGQWAPTLLIIGVYNKVVKIERELRQ